MASLAVIGVYVTIGLLDCIAWRDRARDAAGRPLSDEAGKPILEARPLSVLDRVCTPLRVRTEKTYSAPLAAVQYTKETVVRPDGTRAREYPRLRHPRRHLFGTDRTGNDVFFMALKGGRTALLIGGLATLIVIPLAIAFGLAAGYYGKRVDDLIQYTYTTLSSIPDILLIAAFILIFGRGLPQLCIILGITSWTGLCRLLRGEALKLRELDYVQAARALGSSDFKIIVRHLLPNVMHIVLISFVLRFSDLVLTEAVLSYLGIGVDPGTGSWGLMINAARQELTRDPAVWWNLTAAFGFMLGLVLPVNLFGDALRDALDPRLKTR
jgi:peptide/nickel transport system permease protein